jgi:hypothetical protein
MLTPEQIELERKRFGIKVEPEGRTSINETKEERLKRFDDAINAAKEANPKINNLLPKSGPKTEQQIAEQKANDPMRQGVFGKALGTGFDLLKGAAKGLGKTVVDVGTMANKINPLLSKEAKESISKTATGLKEEVLKPQGTAEKIGMGAEQIGELLIPIPGLAGAGKVAAGVNLLSKAGLKGAGKLIAKEAADIGAKTYLQTGGDTEEALKASLFGAGGALAGKVAEPVLKFVPKAIATYLEKENLRLTPTQKTNLNTKLSGAVEWLTQNNVVGTPQARLSKVDDIYESTEDTLQKYLNSSDKTVNKNKLLEELNGLKLKYQNERDVLAVEKQIDSVIDTIKSKYQDEIPVARLNDFKRSTYKNAYNKAGDKVLDTVEHDIGDVAKINIESATKGDLINGKDISEFNKEYGNIINARKLLKIAEGRKQIGIIGRLVTMGIASSIGSAVGGPVGGAIGFAVANPVAEGLAGTFTRSLLEKGLIDASRLPAGEIEQVVLRSLLPYLREQPDESTK